ncbi:MAG TPA: acetate/propionate family kinase [Chthonomonadaceae bacterium]|nr:acetate/propionate family kinase [Chthonomonadaceae bacterium]
MNLLVLNAGSSSLKYTLFRLLGHGPVAESEEILAAGEVERVGTAGSRLVPAGVPSGAGTGKSAATDGLHGVPTPAVAAAPHGKSPDGGVPTASSAGDSREPANFRRASDMTVDESDAGERGEPPDASGGTAISAAEDDSEAADAGGAAAALHSGPAAEEGEPVGASTAGDAARLLIRRLVGGLAGVTVRIDAVAHRIVHGGLHFCGPARITEAALAALHELCDIAPLHNPSGVEGIDAAREALPGVPNVAVFDTAFHHDLPAVAAEYALPRDLAARLSLRRYGFHGISYRYVVESALNLLERPAAGTRLVVCHLGSGASVCAVRDGRSVDTSMGFTPIEGLIMATRPGDLDPGLLTYLLRTGQLTVEQLDGVLNHESGLLGLSGLSGDVRDLDAEAARGSAHAVLALECFAYRVRKYVGAYAAVLGGVDAVVFTGGIGERSPATRARICQGMEFLGLGVDADRNAAADGRQPVPIGARDPERVLVVPTDEQRQIAREAFALLHQSE